MILSFDCRFTYPGGFQLQAAFSTTARITGLIGPSGAGKSTIFGLIAGWLRPTAGVIRLGARTLVDSAAGVCLPPEQRRLGVLYQDLLLFPHLTVRQNLCFGQGRPGSKPMDLQRVVDVLDIGTLLDRPPGTLSGGQKQRVALGRALLAGPDMLLLDEPFTALDEALRERVLDYLERVLAEWQLPTLLISHTRADVARLAEQVVVLEAGKVST